MAEEIPVSVDYTSRDYYSLREELIARIQDRVPDWSATDPSDFGVALVDAFSYMGDIMSYYIDRVANENFIATATQRESLLSIAETYGYTPSGYANALVTVTFYNNSSSAVTIPAGTRVSGEVIADDESNEVNVITFTTKEDIVVPLKVGSNRGEADGLCEEGIYNTVEANNAFGTQLGSSDGSADQSFDVPDDPVVADSVEVYVQSGNTFRKWTRVQHLIDYGPNDPVYTTRFDKNNRVFILFGDGISGAIPTRNAAIRAKYIIGGGNIGNVSAGVINTLVYIPGLSESQTSAIAGVIDIDNLEVAVGGQDPESNTSIRSNAPLFLRTQNRAITLDDYKNLALSVENCGKAKAVASSYTSITLYIAPQRDDIDGDPAPGLDDLGAPTVEWTSLRDAVKSYLSDKTLAGVTVTVTQPTYVPVTMNVQYRRDPAYTVAVAEKSLKQAIVDNFGYNYIEFGELLTVQDVEFAIQGIPGILSAKCQFLYKTGGTPSLTQIQALDNEVLSFSEADIIVEAL
jgi:hypothetical protein